MTDGVISKKDNVKRASLTVEKMGGIYDYFWHPGVSKGGIILTQTKGDNMAKARSAALQKEINRLAAEIRLEHSKLEGAGKKDLQFIRKHLRKAAKAMKRSVRKTKPSPGGKKKAPASGAPKLPPSGARQHGTKKTGPPVNVQGRE